MVFRFGFLGDTYCFRFTELIGSNRVGEDALHRTSNFLRSQDYHFIYCYCESYGHQPSTNYISYLAARRALCVPGGDNETAAAHESSFIGVGFNWIEASRRGRTIRLILLIYFIFDLI